MDVIWVLLAADARRRWRSWLAVMVLVGIAGGLTMASVAGWRRTTTAMDRFIEYHRPYNAYVEGALDRDDVLAIDGVVAAQGGDYFLLVPVDRDGEPHPELLGNVSPFSYTDPGMFRSAARPIVVAGRLSDPEVESEVVVDEELAKLLNLRPGSDFAMQAYGLDQAEDLFENLGRLAPTGDTLTFTATGIIRSPQDVQRRQEVPEVVYLGSSEVLLGPAFQAAHRGVDVASLGVLFGDLSGPGADQYELRVDFDRTSRADLEAAVRALDDEAAIDFGASDAQTAADEAQRRIGIESSLLLAFAVVVAVGGLVVALQALRRQLEDDVATHQAMHVLGMDRRMGVRVSLLKGGVVALGAATGAVAVAVALSPLTPIGVARRAEVDPGLDVDLTVLALGSTLLATLVIGRMVVAVWRATGLSASRVGAARIGLGDRGARAGLPPSVVAGVRAAGLVSGGSTVAVTAFVAAVGIVGGLGFVASEERLASDPELWGWTFDAVVGDGNDPAVAERADALLPDDPLIASYALVNDLDDVAIGANDTVVDVGASALDQVGGLIEPRMLAGLTPRADDEIALGGVTARQLGVGIGEEVQVDLGSSPTTFMVSGLAVLNLGFDQEQIGEGSILTPSGIERAGGDLEPTYVLVEYAPGVDPDEAYRSLREDWGNTVLRPIRTTDVNQLHDVRYLPVGFSLLLGLLAAVTLVFVLALTIRRRRRDLALLRTLGFVGRQLRASLAAQAVTLLLPAVTLGALAGVVIGRVAWSATATSLGAPLVQVTPIVPAVAVVAGALLLGVLIAVVPGGRAARARPAVILRTE